MYHNFSYCGYHLKKKKKIKDFSLATFPGEDDVRISQDTEFGRCGGGVCSYSHLIFSHSMSFLKSLV